MTKPFAAVRLVALQLGLGALVGCAVFQPPSKSPLEMWFEVENGQSLGIARAMTDGQRTLIQFKTTEPIGALVTDDSGWTVTWSKIGPYMVIDGVQPLVHVRVGDTDATVRLVIAGEK